MPPFVGAVMVHCRERGDEMIVGDLSHLHIYEQGGSAQVSELHSQQKTKKKSYFGQMCVYCNDAAGGSPLHHSHHPS